MCEETRAEEQLDGDETRTKLLTAIGAITKMKSGTLTGVERLEDLNDWDSLAIFDFLLEAEKRFNAEIHFESLAKCQTVEDLVSLVAGATLRKTS